MVGNYKEETKKTTVQVERETHTMLFKVLRGSSVKYELRMGRPRQFCKFGVIEITENVAPNNRDSRSKTP
jgi:hypothetical protein